MLKICSKIFDKQANKVSQKSTLMGKLRLWFFGLGPKSLLPAKRILHKQDAMLGTDLFKSIEAFTEGYHMGLEACNVPSLIHALETKSSYGKVFAYEGAGMAMALRRALPFGSKVLWQTFLGAASSQYGMIFAGVGMLFAKVPMSFSRYMRKLEPLPHERFRTTVIDGLGFAQGFFYPEKTLDAQIIPAGIKGCQSEAFDHGVGRSLWFSTRGDSDKIKLIIDRFAESRRSFLWRGIGFACCFAGGFEKEHINSLCAAAGRFQNDLAVGAAFALYIRGIQGMTQHALILIEHLWQQPTELVVQCVQQKRPEFDDVNKSIRYKEWMDSVHDLLNKR